MSVVAKTERLILRAFEPQDVDAFAALVMDAEVMRYSRDGRPLSRERAAWWFNGIVRDTARDGYSLWAVCEKDTQLFVGYCGVSRQHCEGQVETELGWRLMPAFWGRGYATEAARAARDKAFELVQPAYIVSWIEPANLPSIRVAEKLGMTPWKDITWHDKLVRVYRFNATD